ncbi:MAG: hypothetical protein CVU88_01670 [Firmicutes bacterium HGW-Firmicutes-13]|nr:MAG: hypothetical protein CVU88_01670 [Firmicutes bacterium HGW-Firmicutes-13]
MRPRVGHIQFLNCMPLYYGLVMNGILLDIELTKGTPTELNNLLVEGKLDISPISSIEYARNYHKLILLPDITVSADGEVKSILFFSKLPVEKLDNKKIALTSTSVTSQVLLQIIFKEKYNVNPRYFVCPPEIGPMLMEGEGALLIGDDALKTAYELKDRLYIYDLGQEWKSLTGYPMVYAVWAAYKKFVLEKTELTREVYRAFLHSMEYSLANLDDAAESASRWEPYSPAYLKSYFLSLSFSFKEKYVRGLMEFYRLAHKYGHIPEVPPLEFLEV